MDAKVKVAYSDEELQEFKELILQKLEQATRDYEALRDNAISAGNDIGDTSPTFRRSKKAQLILAEVRMDEWQSVCLSLFKAYKPL